MTTADFAELAAGGHGNLIISNLLFLQDPSVEVCEKLLTNNYSISVSLTACINLLKL